MENKFKKIMMVILALCLIMPMVSAANIQEFLKAMESDPTSYYIWHKQTKPEMTERINDFASNFLGINIVSTQPPVGKSFIIIGVDGDEEIGDVHIRAKATSFAELIQGDVDYLAIYITIEDGYNIAQAAKLKDEIDFNNDNKVTISEERAHILNVILDYLLIYKGKPIDKEEVLVVNGQIDYPRHPKCSEFKGYDNGPNKKAAYYHQGHLIGDFCTYGGKLYELTCNKGLISYGEPTKCTVGCYDGKCMPPIFDFIEQYMKSQMIVNKFGEGIKSWVDS